MASPAGVHGFQSTQNGKKITFRRFPLQTPLIQVLHVKHNHWIVATTIHFDNPDDAAVTFDVYDSAGGHNPLDLDSKQQICSLVQMQEQRTVSIRVVNTQHQPNNFDCGLFALANATELVLEKDPKLCFYDVSRMRPHLLSCLDECKISSFPVKKQRRVTPGYTFTKVYKEVLYCYCQRINEPNRQMIMCDNCRSWFHYDCAGIVSDEVDGEWLCTCCSCI